MDPSPLPIACICFDFDGTIANSMPALEKQAVKVLCTYFSISPLKARSAYRRTTGLPFSQQVKQIFPHKPYRVRQQAIDEFENQKHKCLADSLPFRDTWTVLRKLKERGYKIAISSSTTRSEIKDYLTRHGLNKFVDRILAYRLGFEKGKDHFDNLLRREKLRKHQVLYIGDSLNDMKRSFQYGIFFVGITGPMFRSTDFTVTDLNHSVVHFPTIKTLSGLFPLLETFGTSPSQRARQPFS